MKNKIYNLGELNSIWVNFGINEIINSAKKTRGEPDSMKIVQAERIYRFREKDTIFALWDKQGYLWEVPESGISLPEGQEQINMAFPIIIHFDTEGRVKEMKQEALFKRS